jgi:hypothetical protein
MLLSFFCKQSTVRHRNRFNNFIQILSCICQILALIDQSFRGIAELMKFIADVVYMITSSCMQAQTHLELMRHPTPADYPPLSGGGAHTMAHAPQVAGAGSNPYGKPQQHHGGGHSQRSTHPQQQQGGGGHPQHSAYPQQQQQGYPQQSAYPQQQQQGGGYPQQSAHPQTQGGYYPQQGGAYPQQYGGYPPQQGPYVGQPVGYPQQGGYPPQQRYPQQGYPQQSPPPAY